MGQKTGVIMKYLSVNELKNELVVKMFSEMPPELYQLCSSENLTISTDFHTALSGSFTKEEKQKFVGLCLAGYEHL